LISIFWQNKFKEARDIARKFIEERLKRKILGGFGSSSFDPKPPDNVPVMN